VFLLTINIFRAKIKKKREAAGYERNS
jgi:hypothetical protein